MTLNTSVKFAVFWIYFLPLRAQKAQSGRAATKVFFELRNTRNSAKNSIVKTTSLSAFRVVSYIS